MWAPRRGCILRWLGLRSCKINTLLLAVFWFGTWVFFSGLVFVHRTMYSDLCTDDKSKRILHRVNFKETVIGH
ncbi:hypothetical protein AAFF_G00176650 [Aldrovandia affinis]|uniref:Uncharacterized protein n=1 Tax=Aldrovandia affinis TaxID=143900 RepID=A0AAD7W713_9TELE|nr:hypothetical protein AAFF_G00176650 [Aldrovandia affinis]